MCIEVWSALLGALIGGFFAIGSNFIIDGYQTKRFKENLKKLIILEIESLETGLKNLLNSYNNTNCKIIFFNSFYNEKGPYYNFQTDIQNLKKAEANLIYQFYSNLTSAENNRALIIQYINSNPSLIEPILNEDSDAVKLQKKAIITLSLAIRDNLTECINKIDPIKQLETEE